MAVESWLAQAVNKTRLTKGCLVKPRLLAASEQSGMAVESWLAQAVNKTRLTEGCLVKPRLTKSIRIDKSSMP
jgi:quinol monooxygenase YgiN